MVLCQPGRLSGVDADGGRHKLVFGRVREDMGGLQTKADITAGMFYLDMTDRLQDHQVMFAAVTVDSGAIHANGFSVVI